jgi:S-adenosylmethionine hydrolase
MIVLFTDFGADDIYVGQLKAALMQDLPPGAIVVDLLHNAPPYGVHASAHLLAALERRFPAGAVFLAVIDPGVGSSRDAVIVRADDKWFVGPDNGLLSVVTARARQSESWRIVWRPRELSASFHGRDLFAPVAARAATNNLPSDWMQQVQALHVQFGAHDLHEIIYIDHYGNALTGLRAAAVERTAAISVRGHRVYNARVFADAPAGTAFWYENSIGLVEVAANQRDAVALFGIEVGDVVSVIAATPN